MAAEAGNFYKKQGKDLIDVLNQKKDAGTPILGICLGMQILFEKGYEVKELSLIHI